MNKWAFIIVLAFASVALYTLGRKKLRISEKGIGLIKDVEGFSAVPYQDVAGIWTIGYGHKILETDPYYPYGPVREISREHAEMLLIADLWNAENCISRNVKVPVTANQYDALVSFIYNIGCGAFSSSTMLKKINANQIEDAGEEFKRWIYANKKEVAGLVTRRARERVLFLTA